MLGTFSVGKTSLVRRFVHGLFDDRYLSTIGVQIYEKQLPSIPGRRAENLKLICWDLANIEKLTPAIKNYFRGASAAIVVFDLTRPATFDVKDIHLDAFKQVNPLAGLVFAGNKIDLLPDVSSPPSELADLAGSHSAPLLFTSAKSGAGVAEMFAALGQLLLR